MGTSIAFLDLLDMKAQGNPEVTGSYDNSDELEIESEIKDELLCEAYFRNLRNIKGKKHIKDIRKYNDDLDLSVYVLLGIQQRQDIRRDLSDVLSLKIDEKNFRKLVADELRLMRYEAQNGYRNLKLKDQEKILDCRINFWKFLFGNYNIFFSKRTNSLGHYLPLGKDLTIHTIRGYKPRGLFFQNDKYLKKSPYLVYKKIKRRN